MSDRDSLLTDIEIASLEAKLAVFKAITARHCRFLVWCCR
jgi:hypothetical protein